MPSCVFCHNFGDFVDAIALALLPCTGYQLSLSRFPRRKLAEAFGFI